MSRTAHNRGRIRLAQAAAILLIFSAAQRVDAQTRLGADHVTAAHPAGPRCDTNLAAPVPGKSIEKASLEAWFATVAGKDEAKTLSKGTVYIVHVAKWRTGDSKAPFPPRLVSSVWAAYDYNGEASVHARFDDQGNPFIYNRTSTRLIGITQFDQNVTESDVDIAYLTSTTPAKKENVANLGVLLGALAGVAAKGTTSCKLYVAGGEIKHDSPLPLKINLTYVVKPTKANDPKTEAAKDSAKGEKGGDSGGSDAAAAEGAPVDCTAVSKDSPCKVSRSILDKDREFWDLSLGLSLPGVREEIHDASNLAGKPSVTTHTDLYAFLDVYPSAFKTDKNTAWPHFTFGIPAAGQPFHRPFFGMALPVTTWLRMNRHLPFKLDFVGGMVWMKRNYVEANAQNVLELKWDRIWRPMFGVELPVGQLVGRITKIGK